MNREAKIRYCLLAALYCNPALGQPERPAILVIDLANYVEYQGDIADPQKFAINPYPAPASDSAKNFGVATILADIVAVNGKPAKGLFASRRQVIEASPAPTPGMTVADVRRTTIREQAIEILQSDGTPIGTIMALGLSGGSVPPASPSGPTGGNWAIVGGTGAFLGARGQEEGWGGTPFAFPETASMAEDPINRRMYHKGGTFRFTLHVIPMSRPEVVTTASGPAVTHSSDFTPVSAARPAAPGEVLSLFATGLGPVRAGVEPGQPFPSSPLAAVNSPVEGEREVRRGAGCRRLSRRGGRLSGELSVAPGHHKRRGHDPVERGLDCGGACEYQGPVT
jgi:hypothetical protein